MFAFSNGGGRTELFSREVRAASEPSSSLPPLGTLDEIAHQLTHGFWGGDVHHFDVTQGGTITVNLTALTTNGRSVAREALALWSDIIGVTFQEVSSEGQIMFDDLAIGTGAFSESEWSNGITDWATVNVSLQRLNLHTYIHEIGHALGLGHTANANSGTAAAVYPDDALWRNDGAAISTMSYFDNAENSYYSDLGFSHVPVRSPQVADIIAIGNLYGLSTTTRTGDTTYGFNNSSGRSTFDASVYPNISYTVFDSGGIDTLDYSGFSANQRIDLNQEAFSNVGASVGNVVIARGTVIENALGGSGGDMIVGNAADNSLSGNGGDDSLHGHGGNDVLEGGAGADLMSGGGGSDLYIVASAADHGAAEIADGGSSGSDELRFSATATAQTLVLFAGDAGIERIVIGTGTAVAAVITGTLSHGVDARALGNGVEILGNNGANILMATAYADALLGAGGDDRLYGGAGNDRLDGGAGADRLYGGTGDDIFIVRDATDYAYENVGEGVDRVISSVSHTLRANVEQLSLTGTANLYGRGNAEANVISGNSGANRLNGYDGNDRLYGGAGNDVLDGGAGDDGMRGDAGNDVYYVDSSRDVIVEGVNGGIDTVYSSATLTLRANVERLNLTGSEAIKGTGNDLANVIGGNDGGNTLTGMAGNDRLFGNGGADALIGGDGNDQLTGGAGRDRMTGGSGADLFLFDDGDFGGTTAATADQIHDFGDAEGDRIDLRAADANALLDGDQAFVWLGSAAFTGTAGELRYAQISGSTFVQGDTDGDGSADFWIRLDGLHSLGTDDIIF